MNSFASPIFANKAIFPARCWIFTGKVSGFFFTMLGLSFPMVRFLLTLSIVFSSSHVVAGPWYSHEGIDDSGNRFLFGISSTKERLTVPDIIISCPGIVNVPGSMRHFVYLLLPNELDLDYDAKQTKINSEVTYSGKLEVEIDGIRTDLEVQRQFSYRNW